MRRTRVVVVVGERDFRDGVVVIIVILWWSMLADAGLLWFMWRL